MRVFPANYINDGRTKCTNDLVKPKVIAQCDKMKCKCKNLDVV